MTIFDMIIILTAFSGLIAAVGAIFANHPNYQKGPEELVEFPNMLADFFYFVPIEWTNLPLAAITIIVLAVVYVALWCAYIMAICYFWFSILKFVGLASEKRSGSQEDEQA